jgi:hypothetical protein
MSIQLEAAALVQNKDVLPLLLEVDALLHQLQIKQILEMLNNYQNKLQMDSQQLQTGTQQLQIHLQNLVAELRANLVQVQAVQLNLTDQIAQHLTVQLDKLAQQLDVQLHLLTTCLPMLL